MGRFAGQRVLLVGIGILAGAVGLVAAGCERRSAPPQARKRVALNRHAADGGRRVTRRRPDRDRQRHDHRERVVLLKGFDRKDVPNLTLHVLQASTLKVLRRVELPLDTQVSLSQLGNCRYFRATAPNSAPRIYRLDDQYQLGRVPASQVPAKCLSHRPKVDVVGKEPAYSLRIAVGASVRTLPLPRERINLPDGIRHRVWPLLFNHDRSALVVSDWSGVGVVADLTQPEYKALVAPLRKPRDDLKPGSLRLSASTGIRLAAADKVVWLVACESRRTSKPRERSRYQTYLSRLHPLSGHIKARMTALGPGCPTLLVHLAPEHLVLASYGRSAYDKGEAFLAILDAQTGQVRHRFPFGCRATEPVRLGGRTYVLCARHLIDVQRGKVVARLPTHPVLPRLSLDSRRLYYLPWGAQQHHAGSAVIHAYDLVQRRVIARGQIPRLGHPNTQTMAEARYLIPLPGDRLIAIGGEMGAHMNHLHVWDPPKKESKAPATAPR